MKFTVTLALAASLLAGTGMATGAKTADTIVWNHGDFGKILKKANDHSKLIFAYFWMDGSQNCASLYGKTLKNADAASYLQDKVCFSANVKDPNMKDVVDRYNVKTVPTMLFINPDGVIEDAIMGYIAPEHFVTELQRIRSGKDTVSDFKRRVGSEPKNLDLQYQLAVKLQDVGNPIEGDAIMATIRKKDPRAKTLIGARAHYEGLQKNFVKEFTGEDGKFQKDRVTQKDIKPLESFLTKSNHDEILYDGWMWMASIYNEIEDAAAGREAKMKAFNHISDERIIDSGTEVCTEFWDMRDSLGKEERRFTLSLARLISEKVEALVDTEYGKSEKYAFLRAKSESTLACANYLNGNKKQAISRMKEAVKLHPKEGWYRDMLAYFQGKPLPGNQEEKAN